jgi:hypothetical protein
MLNTVNDEELAAEAAEFARCVDTVMAALQRFLHGGVADPSELYGDPIESAVASICRPDLVELGNRYAGMIVAGLEAVARLHYARYHASPSRPAQYLWSAVELFRIISRAPSVPMRIPEDIALMLDMLAADDPATVPGLDDPTEAADTAARLIQYATVHRNLAALSRAEALVRRVLDTIPGSDPNRVVYLSNLLGILVRRWEWTGTGLTEEIPALVDLVKDSAHQTDPRWPVLQANAGVACYSVAVRAHRRALLDRSIELVASAASALPDDSPDKAGVLQNLGRAELTCWIWRDRPGTPGDAVAHLERAVALTVAGDPDAADRHAWLAIALLIGDRADPTGAAQQLEAADALDGVPGVQVNARLPAKPGCCSGVPGRTTTRRLIGRLPCSVEFRPARHTHTEGRPRLSPHRPVGAMGEDP